MCEPSVAGVLCVASRSTPRVALRICLFARRRAKRARVDSLKGWHATRRCVRTEARRRVTNSEKPVRAESARHRDFSALSTRRDWRRPRRDIRFLAKALNGTFFQSVLGSKRAGNRDDLRHCRLAGGIRESATRNARSVYYSVSFLAATNDAGAFTNQLTPKFTKRPRWPTFPRARSPRPPSCCT